jgi:hypothetical protein
MTSYTVYYTYNQIILIGLNIALFQKVLIFKFEVFATALLDIHKKNVYRDNHYTYNQILRGGGINYFYHSRTSIYPNLKYTLEG